MRRVLYTSPDVRQAINKVFQNAKKRRVAIVAFVGEGAEAYLPHPKGLQLYCWPKAGGTDPHTLRKLIKRGVKAFFVDRLHMKVYWGEDSGAVITSANLSTNALGSGNLKETGVFLSPEEVDIDRLIKSLKYRPASGKELRQLDRLHKRYKVQNREQLRARVLQQSYGEWYKSPFRQKWRIGLLGGYVKLAERAGKESKEKYGIAKPSNWLSGRCNDYKQGDWVLTFWLKKGRPTKLEWRSIDYSVKVSPSEKGVYDCDNPCQYVQVFPKNRYPPPPFRLDKPIRRAVFEAIQDFNPSTIEKLESTMAPRDLIDLMYKHWRHA
jgi:hypothetical protein